MCSSDLPITAKALSVTGATAADRTYNGLATASVDVTGAALSGVVDGDAVTLVTTGVTATFPDKAVGAGRTVTFAGFTITGDDATNYALVQPTTTATITAKGLAVTGLAGTSRAYDGTRVAAASGSATLAGVVEGDTVTLGGTPVYTFAQAGIGTGIAIATTGYTITGDDAASYTLAQPSLSADITAVALTATVTVNGRTYDGTTGATIASCTLTGVVGTEDVTCDATDATATFASPHAGSRSVSITGLTLAGADAGNYTLASIAPVKIGRAHV